MSNGHCPLVHWSIVNVNKVKLLSERTPGAPPVIFVIITTLTGLKEILQRRRLFAKYCFHLNGLQGIVINGVAALSHFSWNFFYIALFVYFSICLFIQ